MEQGTPTPAIPAGPGALGRALRLWRALRRVKQAAAGDLLGVAQSTVSRWESGAAEPGEEEARRVRALIAARASSAADFELARLVRLSGAPVHLVCDATHRLLAASPARIREFHATENALLGRSLWPCASAEIVAAEASLADHGWYEPAPSSVEAETSACLSRLISIPAGRFRWTRLPLSDGSFARLVETVRLGTA